MASFCYIHPDAPARRKCYQCKQPICPQCQHNLDRHLFCGDECHQDWKEAESKKRTSPKTRTGAPALESLRAEVGKVAELVGALNDRVETVESENTGLAAVVEASSGSIDVSRELMESLTAGLAEVKNRIEDLTQSHESIRARLSSSEKTGASEAMERLEELVRRLKELEDEQRQLASSLGSSPEGEIEPRLGRLESNLHELAASLDQAGAEDNTQAAIERVDLALDRLSRLEAEQRAVSQEVGKVREESSQAALAEVGVLRERLTIIERSARQWRELAKDRWRGVIIQAVLAAVVFVAAGAITFRLLTAGQKPPTADGSMAVAAVAGTTTEPIAGSTAEPPNRVDDENPRYLEPPTIDLTTSVVVLEKSRIDVAGYAPGAQQVTLFVNNTEKSTAVVFNRGFTFARVSLEMGANVIQVKALDESGNVAFSMARIVSRKSASAATVNVAAINRMRGPRSRSNIALTIDAGSSNRRSEHILNVLRQKKLKITFFLTGRFIQTYPDTVLRIVADGHEVGNHTYSHPHATTYTANRRNYTNISEAKLKEELTRTARLFKELTGKDMAPWWRAPYGEHNQEVRRWAEQAGFKHVDWSRTPTNYDMLDWIADPKSRHFLDAQGLLERLTGIDGGAPGGANGGIILCHLGSDRKSDFLDLVLGQAIDTMTMRGYRFVTVTEMFKD